MTLPRRVMLWVTLAVMASIGVVLNIQLRFVEPEIQSSRIAIIAGFAELIRSAPEPDAKAKELQDAFGYPVGLVVRTGLSSSQKDRIFTEGSLDATTVFFPFSGDRLIAIGPLPFLTPPVVRLVLVGIVVALGVAALVAWLLIAPVVRGLRDLEETSKKITHGDLHARTTSEHTQGIAEVALAFNSMADNNQELIKKQEHLLRAVSHEFRTPAARVRFDLELLNSATTADARLERSKRIEDSLDELDELVGELLDYTRYDHNRPQLLKVELAIFDEFESLKVKTPVPDHIKLIFSCNVAEVLHASPKYLRRALSNLLQNAFRHASSEIRVSATSVASAVEIRIEDDGEGIPIADRERIFDPFVRLDESRDRQAGGFGIGLAIVQQIVHWHDAKIIVEDSTLGGACFVLRFPTNA